MTIVEAERAGREIAMGRDDEHNAKLLKAIEELDLEALDKILDEGQTKIYRNEKGEITNTANGDFTNSLDRWKKKV